MTTAEYKRRVIELFQSGTASDEQWDQMAEAVLDASEGGGCAIYVRSIDAAVGWDSELGEIEP